MRFKLEIEGEAHPADLARLVAGLRAAEAPSLEHLTPDPVYMKGGAEGPHAMMGESNPAPVGEPDSNFDAMKNFDFNKMIPNPVAWELFVRVVSQWTVGFNCPIDDEGKPTVAQPDRAELLKELGEGRWPLHILRWVANHGSLQAAVLSALTDKNVEVLQNFGRDELIDLAASVAANIVQVSHAGFPDLAGFYDHSAKWRRNL